MAHVHLVGSTVMVVTTRWERPFVAWRAELEVPVAGVEQVELIERPLPADPRVARRAAGDRADQGRPVGDRQRAAHLRQHPARSAGRAARARPAGGRPPRVRRVAGQHPRRGRRRSRDHDAAGRRDALIGAAGHPGSGEPATRRRHGRSASWPGPVGVSNLRPEPPTTGPAQPLTVHAGAAEPLRRGRRSVRAAARRERITPHRCVRRSQASWARSRPGPVAVGRAR